MSGVQIEVRFGCNVRVRRHHLQELLDHHTQSVPSRLTGCPHQGAVLLPRSQQHGMMSHPSMREFRQVYYDRQLDHSDIADTFGVPR